MKYLLKNGWRAMSTMAKQFASQDIHKFVTGDFPKALLYSRPFRTALILCRFKQTWQRNHSRFWNYAN